MRDIKFRAWEVDDKKMISSYAHVGKDGVMHTIFMDGSHDYKVMQYTGLKDKNGVEIYEGDVVKFQLPLGGFWGDTPKIKTAIVKYVDDLACFIAEWEHSKNKNHISLSEIWLEVIGNIYEHPELLDKDNA